MRTVALAFLLLLMGLGLRAQTRSVRLAYGAVLTLQRAPFNAEGKVLKYYAPKQPNEYRSLRSINGKPVMGTDGELPKYVLSKATLLINGVRYELPVADMYNPWFGAGAQYGPSSEFFRLSKLGPAYKLQAVFSDGAGTYGAEWRLVGKAAKRTVLSKDDDFVMGFFLQGKAAK